MPSKIYQVRYTVGDKTVAHEHYTEKGGKADAKVLSKAIGNAMMGELDVADDGGRLMSRVWEFTGGEMGKPIKREPKPPSDVEILKTAEQTKLPEGPVEKKAKMPKMTEAEKLAKKRADAEALIKSIDEGTYVAPVRGRKAGAAPKTPKDEAERIKKLVEELKCSEKAAQIIVSSSLTSTGRRAHTAIVVIDANGPILASEVVKKLNDGGKEDRIVDLDDVLSSVNHVNYKFSKMDQPWRITVKDAENNDKRLNLASVRIEVSEEAGHNEPEAGNAAAE